MTAYSYIYGHEAYFDEDAGIWRYCDTDQAANGWSGGNRPCPQCGDPPTPEGHDACLGHIPGVYSACCGHGREPGYILWEPGEERAEARFSIELPVWALRLLERLGIA